MVAVTHIQSALATPAVKASKPSASRRRGRVRAVLYSNTPTPIILPTLGAFLPWERSRAKPPMTPKGSPVNALIKKDQKMEGFTIVW